METDTNINFDVNTNIQFKIIYQVTTIGDVSKVISRKIINTEDSQIREALIKLGWTPPDD